MFRNYLLASLRSFIKNRSSFLINFFGLVLAFSSVLVIGAYLQHEVTYDEFHEKGDRIFRVTHNERKAEVPGTRHLATVGPPVGPALKQTFDQIEDAVRMRYTPDHIMRYRQTQNYESRIFYVDPSIFNVFSFQFQAGDDRTALLLPNSVVLT
jgi:putative ABC transport system permease protein